MVVITVAISFSLSAQYSTTQVHNDTGKRPRKRASLQRRLGRPPHGQERGWESGGGSRGLRGMQLLGLSL
eukprot:1199637-Amphidinium_carterae.1